MCRNILHLSFVTARDPSVGRVSEFSNFGHNWSQLVVRVTIWLAVISQCDQRVSGYDCDYNAGCNRYCNHIPTPR